jgi:Fe-S cluster assembly scaffold protein SufB
MPWISCSVSVATTFKNISERNYFHEYLKPSKSIQISCKYLGTVVQKKFYAALNSGCFLWSFCYIPKGVRCSNGTFYLFPYQSSRNRTIWKNSTAKGSYVSYLEGCNCTKSRWKSIARGSRINCVDDAEIKYSTVQKLSWNKEGKGGVYNFDQKRLWKTQKFLGHK